MKKLILAAGLLAPFFVYGQATCDAVISTTEGNVTIREIIEVRSNGTCVDPVVEPPACEPVVEICGDGIDQDCDGVDLACPDPDPIPDPGTPSLTFVEVSVDPPVNNTGAFGVALADWNQNGAIEAISNYHDGSNVLNRWEWDGTKFANLGGVPMPGCDLRVYAYDMTLDGIPDVYCPYVNWPVGRYLAGPGLTEEVRGICGNTRGHDCEPVIRMPNGELELLGRNGNLYERNGTKASYLMDDGIAPVDPKGELDVFGWYMDLDSNGTIEFVDMRPFIDAPCTNVYRRHSFAEDFDGDGDQDFILSDGGSWEAGYFEPQVSCGYHYLENVSGTLVERLLRLNGLGDTSDYHHVYGHSHAVDMDNDGDLDLVVGGNTLTDSYRLLINDGAGTFTRASWALDNTARNPNSGYNERAALAVGDFNSDGCQDVVVSAGASPSIRAFYQVCN